MTIVDNLEMHLEGDEYVDNNRTVSTPAAFAVDPATVYIDTIEMALEDFARIPSHPQQRDTGTHAALLIGKAILEKPLPMHREVAVILVGPINETMMLYRADHRRAIARFAIVGNGHSRRQVWLEGNNPVPVPDTVLVSVYAAADADTALRLYQAFDSMISAKGQADRMQSTLKMAQIEVQSECFRKAAALGKAIAVATAIITEGTLALKHKPVQRANALTISEALPLLGFTRDLREELVALDSLDLKSRSREGELPVTATALAAYLAILRYDMQHGMAFLRNVLEEVGSNIEGAKTPAYVVRELNGHLKKSRPLRGWKPGERDGRIVANILLAFLAFRDGETADFTTATTIIERFLAKARKERAAV